ncbi:MAG: segregation/condensation protein A [Armatimonadetes bacterium]|nr:segregation/condensation protein A [Armatimonadota bacterium]
MAKTREIAPIDQVTAIGVTQPPDIFVECEAFSGSLATLFLCVREGKVDLLGVPLSPICEAFLQYIIDSSGADIDRASAALSLLSYLLERKAWLLLPSEEEEPEELEDEAGVEPWIQEFRPAIEALRELAEERGRVFFRASLAENAAYELPLDLGEVTLFDLSRALQRLLERAVPEPPDAMRRPARSLSEQMVIVMKTLQSQFLPLDQVVQGEFTRTEVVWWFLALLELIRLGQARVRLKGGEVEFARAVTA